MTDLRKKITEAHDFIRAKTTDTYPIGIVLGTGLGGLAKEIETQLVLEYEHIPHFPLSTVESHSGRLIFGTLSGKKVVAMQGRFHYYEGYSMQEITFPIRVMKTLGVKTLCISNACGGLNPLYRKGDIMIIDDHINLIGDNPLIGKNDDELGPRFPDMSTAYDPELKKKLILCFQKMNIPVKKGVYAYVSGPAYETPADIKMIKKLGADLVGMSTVPEVIALHHMGVKVAALSLITNKAAGLSKYPLTHAEVEKIAQRSEQILFNLLAEFCKQFQFS
ncbi:MAG: purine-nucleoside phosphorylase [Candidatus Thermochlorobacter sp.]